MSIDELEEHQLAIAVEAAMKACECDEGIVWGDLNAETLAYFVRRTMTIAQAVAEPVIVG